MAFCSQIVPALKVVYIGEPVTLACLSHTMTKWFRNKHLLSYYTNVIHLKAAVEDDNGVYECRGTMTNGRAFRATAKVVVGSKL